MFMLFSKCETIEDLKSQINLSLYENAQSNQWETVMTSRWQLWPILRWKKTKYKKIQILYQTDEVKDLWLRLVSKTDLFV